MLRMLNDYLIFDLKEQYSQVRFRDEKNLVQVMKDVYNYTKHPFVILIDEWECLFREYQQDQEAQKKYLDFLNFWLKDKEYVALAYMTGILPIKKYGSHSALNMFTEYSMTDSGNLAEYFGFTEAEVQELCEKYEMSFEEALEALWQMDAEKVAKGIEQAHKEISILTYNDENSLSCTVNLAFYFAREYYTVIRELPSGKGFADICFIPRKIHMDKPAVVIELKWDKSAEGAIGQIKDKQYIDALKDYHGNLLLVGINYGHQVIYYLDTNTEFFLH